MDAHFCKPSRARWYHAHCSALMDQKNAIVEMRGPALELSTRVAAVQGLGSKLVSWKLLTIPRPYLSIYLSSFRCFGASHGDYHKSIACLLQNYHENFDIFQIHAKKMEAEVAELKKQVSALTKELARVSGTYIHNPENPKLPIYTRESVHRRHDAEFCSDESEVRKTHFKYGYYLDKCLYNEVRISFPHLEYCCLFQQDYCPPLNTMSCTHIHITHSPRSSTSSPTTPTPM